MHGSRTAAELASGRALAIDRRAALRSDRDVHARRRVVSRARMLHRNYFFLNGGLVLSLALACGGGGTGTDSDGSSSSGGGSSSSSSGGEGSSSGVTGGGSSSSGGSEGDSETGAGLDPRLADCLRINACEAEGGTPIGLQACLGYVLDERWSWATTGPARLDLAAMACKLAATDCAGVLACTPAKEAFAETCADFPFTDRCEGDVWVFCDENGAPLSAMDCAAAGQSCHQNFWAGCGAETCDYETFESACDEADPGVLIQCTPANTLERIDCRTQYSYVNVNGQEGEEVYAIAGEVCGFDEQRNANGCIGTGADCDFFSQKCDGDVLETCAGGKLGHRDCAALEPAGQSCGFVPSGAFAGAAACGFVEPQCDLDGDESCEGGEIGYCDFGAPATLDCAAHGYSGCATAPLGARTVAYCTP